MKKKKHVKDQRIIETYCKTRKQEKLAKKYVIMKIF